VSLRDWLADEQLIPEDIMAFIASLEVEEDFE